MDYRRFDFSVLTATTATTATKLAAVNEGVATVAIVAAPTDGIENSCAAVARAARRLAEASICPLPRQLNTNLCFVCDRPDRPEAPLLAILSDIPSEHHWMHSGCWPEHARRCAAHRANVASGLRPR